MNPSRAVAIVINLTVSLNFVSIAPTPYANWKLGCPPWFCGRSRGMRDGGQGGAPALVLLLTAPGATWPDPRPSLLSTGVRGARPRLLSPGVAPSVLSL